MQYSVLDAYTAKHVVKGDDNARSDGGDARCCWLPGRPGGGRGDLRKPGRDEASIASRPRAGASGRVRGLAVAALFWAFASAASAFDAVPGEIVCVAGRPHVSFSVPVGALAGQSGMVWIGAVFRENTALGYSWYQDAWVSPPGGLLPPFRELGPLAAESVVIPVVQSLDWTPGSPNPSFSDLQAWLYSVGIGVLPAEAAQTAAAESAAFAQAEVLRTAPPPPPIERESGDDVAWEVLMTARRDGAARRQAAVAALAPQFAGTSSAGAFQDESSTAQAAITNPAARPIPSAVPQALIERGYVEKEMLDSQRAYQVVLAQPDDNAMTCLSGE